MLSILDIAIGMFDCDFLKWNPSKWTSGWFSVADTPFQFGFLELLSANHQFFGNCLNTLTMEMALFWSAFGVLCYIESTEKFTFLFEVFKTQIIHVIPDKLTSDAIWLCSAECLSFMRSLSVFMNYTLTLIFSLFWIYSNLNDVSCRMAGASRLFWPGTTSFYTQLNKLLAIISVLV